MTRVEACKFVEAEIGAMQSMIDNLLERYVRPDSELEGHLQHAGNRLDIALGARVKKSALRTKPKARYPGHV